MGLFSKKIKPTRITAYIDQLTHPTKSELDWNAVFELCEALNTTELGEKEARKVCQKKLQSTEPQALVLTIELLEALLQNCEKKMVPELKAHSFQNDMKHMLESKTLSQRVRRRLVRFFQVWRMQYVNDPEVSQFLLTYDPQDDYAAGQPPVDHRMKKPDVNETLEFAKNSGQLLSQALSFTDPIKEDIRENALIKEFYGKCKEAQKLISHHLGEIEETETITALINANNELLGCFKSYDEMLEQRSVNEATLNSRTLHNRLSREIQPYSVEEASSSKQNVAVIQSNDPFDPFSDTQEISIGHSDHSANNNTGSTHTQLPPPLTPRIIHD